MMAVMKKLICCLVILAAAGESSAGVCKAKTTTPMPPTITGTPPLEIQLPLSARRNMPEKYEMFYAYTDYVSSIQDAREFCYARNQQLLTFDNVTVMWEAVVKNTDIMDGINKKGKRSYLIDAVLKQSSSAVFIVTFPSGVAGHIDDPFSVYLLSNFTDGFNYLYYGYPSTASSETMFFTGTGEVNVETAIICTNNDVISEE